MKPSEVDWGILRGAAAALSVSVVLSAAALTASYYFWSNMDEGYERENAKLLGSRGRYQTVDEEEEGIIETYLPRYEALAARGIIGRERRLDWIESLRAVSRQLKVPSVRYAISSQEAYAPEFPVQTGAYHVYSSEMDLDLGLLHEEDLPRLLAGLDERALGLYSVDSCDLRRVNDFFGAEPTEPNVSARCKLRWTTVRQSDPDGSES